MVNLRVQIEKFISNRTKNLVQYICERRNSPQVGCMLGRSQRHVSSRILSYHLVNARESQIVVDRNTSQQIMLFFLSNIDPDQHDWEHDKMRSFALCYDGIRSDAMVPIVEAIVLIVEKHLAAKKFSTINPIVKIDIKT